MAKRAAYRCSNPDCRTTTVGPNSDPKKATLIGEAAHIFGARPIAKRYDPNMSDVARAEITNGIWLCTNCHKKIDRDPELFSTEVLFTWREQHEHYVNAELGSVTDRIVFEQQLSRIRPLNEYPPQLRRIALDKPKGWEWRLTAELLRHLNKPVLRKLRDLKEGLYFHPQESVSSENAPAWISARINEMSNLTPPFEGLLDRLSASWGNSGKEGDLDEIVHVCQLLKENLTRVVEHEERVQFSDLPNEYCRLIDLLKDCLGSQAEKFASIPDDLDEIVQLIDSDHTGTKENPLVVKKTIIFELPKGWGRKMERELKKIEKHSAIYPDKGGGWSSLFGVLVLIALIILIF